jgi:dTDP-4-amino-4,6-dideoxygalactose transaminase
MTSQPDFLPFALPDIGEEEIAEVVACLRSGWITTGPKAREFEQDFAQFIGGGVQAVSVNSATAGLHLALEAFGIGPGDKVLTTPYTFTATAEVIRYLGAEPVFADIDPRTFNLDPAAAEAALAADSGIRAMIPVHFAGCACDMDALGALAAARGIPILEDAAHALPTTWRGQLIGTLSQATVFSFYATKTIATGEGGMIVSRDEKLLQRCRTMRLHGINRDVFDRYNSTAPAWYYEVVAPGFKYNMPDPAAAMGIPQLRKAYAFQKRRQAIADRYDRAFAGLPLDVPGRDSPDDMHAWHLYVIRLRQEALRIDRNRFIELMAERGIGTSVHFIPLHLQPYWRDRYGFTPASFPVASAVYERAVSLPIYTRMSDQDVDRVIQAVSGILTDNAG